MMTLEQINSHERDKDIIFYEGPHKYFYKNKIQFETSVTGFIHLFVPAFDANKIVDLIIKKKCRPQTLNKYIGMTKENILNKWESEKKLACLLGTRLHLLIEEYFNNIHLHIEKELLPVEFQYFQRFINSKSIDYLVPYRTEWIVYDTDLNLAGSIDMCFYNKKTDKYVLYDWKRSKEIKKNAKEYLLEPLSNLQNCNYVTYSLQLNMYKFLLEKNYNISIESMHLLVMHPRYNQYQKYDIMDMSSDIFKIIEYRTKNTSKLI